MTAGYSHVEKLLKPKITLPDPVLWEREWKTLAQVIRLSGLRLPDTGTVVDAGCGLQGLRTPVERSGLSYVGLDIDDLNFEHEPLSRNFSGVSMVVSLAVIEHLESPIVYLQGIRDCLEPGGLAVFSTPNIKFAKMAFWDNPGHVHPYSAKSLALLVSAAGFEVGGVFPGLRAKPDWMLTFPFSFGYAGRLPVRKNHTTGVRRYFSGRSSSVFLVAKAPE